MEHAATIQIAPEMQKAGKIFCFLLTTSVAQLCGRMRQLWLKCLNIALTSAFPPQRVIHALFSVVLGGQGSQPGLAHHATKLPVPPNFVTCEDPRGPDVMAPQAAFGSWIRGCAPMG